MQKRDEEAKTLETYDRNAQPWAASHAVFNDWKWAITRFHELLPGGKVIEIGCGGGRDAVDLIAAGYDYLGTDASKGMIEVATAFVPEAIFKQLNIYELAHLNTQYDGFWACAVLLHIPKARIDTALQAIRTILKPGAIGVITLKDGDDEDFEIRDKDDRHEERLFAYWRKDPFVEALERNNFRLLEYKYQPVSARTNWHVFFVKKR